MGDTQKSQTISTLRKSFRQLRKNESTGADKITAKQYAVKLDENLYNLYQRLRRGQYVASPVNRHDPLKDQHETLCSKLRGFYQYFGVRSNYKVLEVVYEYAEKAWRRWLGRRDRDGYISHEKFRRILRTFPLPRPRIVHNI
jgi:hypothetical protein